MPHLTEQEITRLVCARLAGKKPTSASVADANTEPERHLAECADCRDWLESASAQVSAARFPAWLLEDVEADDVLAEEPQTERSAAEWTDISTETESPGLLSGAALISLLTTPPVALHSDSVEVEAVITARSPSVTVDASPPADIHPATPSTTAANGATTKPVGTSAKVLKASSEAEKKSAKFSRQLGWRERWGGISTRQLVPAMGGAFALVALLGYGLSQRERVRRLQENATIQAAQIAQARQEAELMRRALETARADTVAQRRKLEVEQSKADATERKLFQAEKKLAAVLRRPVITPNPKESPPVLPILPQKPSRILLADNLLVLSAIDRASGEGGSADRSVPAPNAPVIRLLRPARIVVLTGPLTLAWQPITGANSLKLTVDDMGQNVNAPMLEGTNVVNQEIPTNVRTWKIPDHLLKFGHIYQWSVTAFDSESDPLASSTAAFGVASRKALRDINEAQRNKANDPLALAIAYNNNGLLYKAKTELETVLETSIDPDSALARPDWRQAGEAMLRAIRQRLAKPFTSP